MNNDILNNNQIFILKIQSYNLNVFICSSWVWNLERNSRFDFVPVVSERMILASMTDPNTYLGGDNWMLARPFTKDTWFMILITTVIFLTIMKLFSFLPVIKSIDFKTPEKA